jgi:hypothetical protein
MKKIPLRSVYLYPATNGYVIEATYRPESESYERDVDRKTVVLAADDIGAIVTALFAEPFIEIEGD